VWPVVHAPIEAVAVAAPPAAVEAPVPSVHEAAPSPPTPPQGRRGVISMLPPVDEEPAVAVATASAPRRELAVRGSPVHRHAAHAMSTSGIGEDDEYDIPAFLRRNAE
jgi:hypothetical protein